MYIYYIYAYTYTYIHARTHTKTFYCMVIETYILYTYSTTSTTTYIHHHLHHHIHTPPPPPPPPSPLPAFKGAFEVSASWNASASKISDVSVRSRLDQNCTFLNPFAPSSSVTVMCEGAKQTVAWSHSKEFFSFEMSAGVECAVRAS